MGLVRVSGCLIVLTFSCYMWLLAERGRQYLVEQPAQTREGAPGQADPSNHTLSESEASSVEEDEVSEWLNVGINILMLISTFLCYDLLVTNILLFSLSTDTFFLRTPLRLLLCCMIGVLAAAGWFELPALLQELNLHWLQS